MSDTVQIIVSLLGGGLLGTLLTYIINLRKDKRLGLETIITRYDEDNKRLREDNMRLEDKFDKFATESRRRENENKRKIEALEMQLQLMQSAHVDLPVPHWIKDTTGKMIALNDAFENLFLIPNGKRRGDYLGKTDAEFWPADLAAVYMQHDKKVLSTGKMITVQETAYFGSYSENWDVIKYPMFSGSSKIGTAGIAFKKSDNGTPAG